MKTKDIVKLNFLVLGFLLTIFLIYKLKTGGLGPSIGALFGVQNAGSGTASADFTLKWCDTRVVGIVIPDQFKIFQDGRKWIFESGEKTELHFLSVERWFAENCSIQAKKFDQSEETNLANGKILAFSPAVIVKFVNGQVVMLKKRPDGVYQWRDLTFRSDAFTQAITSLGQLPKK